MPPAGTVAVPLADPVIVVYVNVEAPSKLPIIEPTSADDLPDGTILAGSGVLVAPVGSMKEYSVPPPPRSVTEKIMPAVLAARDGRRSAAPKLRVEVDRARGRTRRTS